MENLSFSESELCELWNRKSKRYVIKSFIKNGEWITKLILHDKCAGGKVVGKLIHKSSGEFLHRPWLHHRNLVSLIDMVSIHDKVSVFISTYQNKSLREIVHDENFVRSSNCFILKKTYVEDVLWGLDYLHRNGLCLMNLSDANVSVCEQPNKAIITDFGNLAQIDKYASFEFSVPVFHQPPELRTQMTTAKCNPISAEMWVVGLMILEVFTQHKIPWALVDYDPKMVLEAIDKIDFETLKVANGESILSIQDFCEFKAFVNIFLSKNPQSRHSARDAALNTFLQSPKHSVNLKKNSPCSIHGVVCSDSVGNYSPDYCRMLSRKLFSRSSNVLRTLNAPEYRCQENKTEKSKSSGCFKHSDYLVNQSNYYIPPPIDQKYYKHDEQIIPNSTKLSSKVNLDKSTLDIVNSEFQDKEINILDGTHPKVRQSINDESKISLSSHHSNPLISCKQFLNENELNSFTPSIISSDNSSNENINVTQNIEPYPTNDSPLNIQNEKLYSKISFQMENGEKNLFDSCGNLLTNCTMSQFQQISPSCINCKNIAQEKNCVPCSMEKYALAHNCGNDSLHQTTSDQVFTTKIMNHREGWNDLSLNQAEDSKRKSKSLISLKKSEHRPQTPVPDLLHETLIPDSKIEPKIVGKTPYTLSKHVLKSSKSVSSSMFNEEQIKYLNAVNNLKKLNDGNMQRELRYSKKPEEKTPVANNFETYNAHSCAYLPSNQPSTRSVQFTVQHIPDVQINVKRIPNCRFNHGNRCPKHQKAELIAQERHRLSKKCDKQGMINNIKATDNYKDNIQLCRNTNVEPREPVCNYENTTIYHDNCSLPDCYLWFSPNTSSNVIDSQLLSPNSLKRNSDIDVAKSKKEQQQKGISTQRLSYTKAIWAGNNLHKNNVDAGLKEFSKHVDECQKLIREEGTLPKKRCNFKVEVETHTRRVIRKKTPAKKMNLPTKTPDYTIIEENSDEKKSKKRNALKKCFCMF